MSPLKFSIFETNIKGITQCGIQTHQTFTYSFIAEEVGTRRWHSHSGALKIDGIYGAVIVHPANNLPVQVWKTETLLQ